MKLTRRISAYFLPVSSLAVLAIAVVAAKPAAQSHYLAFVGTYTTKTESKGIYAYDFDSATGQLTPKGLAAETPDPSWVVIHPNGKYAYAANESGKNSMISAFSLDAKTAKLTLLNQLPALGEDPCYLSFDKSGKYLFVANYTSGNVAVFPILADGKLGEHTALVKDAGTLGPNKERQEAPHAHWVQVSPDNRFVLVADLGLDEILVYHFDVTSGTITPNNPPFAKVYPGTGPRHAIFSRDGKLLFVISELYAGVTAFAYDSRKGLLNALQTASIRPKDFVGRSDGAEIAAYPGDKWLFASNRGYDKISVLYYRPDNGGLIIARDYSTGGKEPRHFALDPTGQFLLAENQNSNSIVVFRINPATGALTQVSQADAVPSPVNLAFVP